MGKTKVFNSFRHVHKGYFARRVLPKLLVRGPAKTILVPRGAQKPSSFIAKRLERQEALAERNTRVLGLPLGTAPRATLLESFSHASCRGHCPTAHTEPS
jgi:hypothetical protein